MGKTIQYGIVITLKSAGEAVAARLERALDKIAERTERISRFSRRALLGIAGAITGIGVAAAQQQAADRKLADALQSVGEASKTAFDRMKALAAAIQDVTTYGDEELQVLIATALNMGVTSDRMEETIQGAIGLSEAFGIDFNSALKMTAMAFQGNYDMLQRYIPALKEAKTEAEKQSITQAGMAAGFAQAKGKAEELGGRIVQLKGLLGDLLQQIGQTILNTDDWGEAVNKLKGRVNDAIDWVKDLSAAQIEQIRTWGKVTLAVLGFTAVLNPLARALSSVIGAARGAGYALALLYAHPVVAVTAAFAAATLALGRALEKATHYTAQLTDTARDALQAHRGHVEVTQKLWKELQSLAAKSRLSNAEMKRSQEIITKLESMWGDLGLSVNTATTEILGMADGQNVLNQRMREAQLGQLTARISELRANWTELRNEYDDLVGKMHVGGMLGLIGPSEEKVNRLAELLILRMRAATEEIAALKMEAAALKAGDWSGLEAGKKAGEAAAEGLKDSGDALKDILKKLGVDGGQELADALADAGRQGGGRSGNAAAEGFRIAFVGPFARTLNWLEAALENIFRKWSKELVPARSPAEILGRRIEYKERMQRHLQRHGHGMEAARVGREVFELQEALRAAEEGGKAPTEQMRFLTDRQRQLLHGINAQQQTQQDAAREQFETVNGFVEEHGAFLEGLTEYSRATRSELENLRALVRRLSKAKA